MRTDGERAGAERHARLDPVLPRRERPARRVGAVDGREGRAVDVPDELLDRRLDHRGERQGVALARRLRIEEQAQAGLGRDDPRRSVSSTPARAAARRRGAGDRLGQARQALPLEPGGVARRQLDVGPRLDLGRRRRGGGERAAAPVDRHRAVRPAVLERLAVAGSHSSTTRSQAGVARAPVSAQRRSAR